ncbi:MAG: hypothetical protein ACFB50_16855 [Rubrobacteraceae bacterium]
MSAMSLDEKTQTTSVGSHDGLGAGKDTQIRGYLPAVGRQLEEHPGRRYGGEW